MAISERDDKRYGKRQLKVESIMMNENIPTNPFVKLMPTSSEASILPIIKPVTGIPLPDVILKREGNKLSLEAASGICPCSNIQPFKAPKHAIDAPVATRTEAHLPHALPAASAKGAAECARSAGDTIPITATVLDK